MLVSLADYTFCDGTLAGGVAISELRCRADRLWEFVVPLGDDNPTLFNRVLTTIDFTFTVKRTHTSTLVAEAFIITLDNKIPDTGTITITTTGPSPTTRQLPEGFVLEQVLLLQNGATTFHQYHLIGGPPIEV